METSESARCVSEAKRNGPSKTQTLLQSVSGASDLLYDAEHFDLTSCFSDRRSTVDVDYVRGADQRRITYGWNHDFVVDGNVVAFEDYPRYDNPYAQVEWGDKRMKVRAGDEVISLDFEAGTMVPKPF